MLKEINGKFTSAKIYAKEFDNGVIKQVQTICDHPLFENCDVRIMPDCHRGKGCVIGFTSTMPMGGEIIPNIIGVDQFCGMLTVKLKKAKTINDFAKLDKVIKENIPSGQNCRNKLSDLIPEELIENIKKINMDYLNEKSNLDLRKIGSLGGGNHFISVEKGKTGTYLIIHTGSRNFGKKLAIYFQKLAIEQNCYGEGELKNLSYLSGKNAENYLYCADICREYAYYSRQIIAKEILKNMNWKSEDKFETLHNYIGNDNIIRKGAISCYKDEKVLIPLNMADGSLICIGKGNSDWNNSGPHGAGRILSRTQAKDQLSMKDYKKQMSKVYSSCVSISTLDESPMAYKNSDKIIHAVVSTADIIDHLKPLYNFKAEE